MCDFTGVAYEMAEATKRQGKEIAAIPCADPDEETFHLQADGFWGFEKGFHDAEELRRR